MEDISPMGLGLQAPSHSSAPKKRSLKKLLVFVAILALLIGGVYFGISQLFGQGSMQEEAIISPTPTMIIEETPTETPTPEISPTDSPIETPTPKPTGNPVDKTTGLDRSQITIEIQNGSGASGVAAKVSSFLKNLGYQVTKTGNADNFDYQNVTISVKSAFAKYLPLLKSDIMAEYSIGTTNADLSASSSADAVVIIGK